MGDERMRGRIPAERVVLTSFVVDVLDIFLGVLVALISGSMVMVSQAMEGVADLVASGFLVVGVKRSRRRSDSKHPYGYGRELYFWTFLAAIITFSVTSVVTFYLGLKRFLNPGEIENIGLAYAVLILTTATNGYSLSLSMRRLVGRRNISSWWRIFTNSALIETKTTLILDTMGTLASVLGLGALILYRSTGNMKFDGIGAMLIGLTLAALALLIVEGARDLLVGQSASPEVNERIKEAALSFGHVRKVIDLKTLHQGSDRLLVNMEVNLDDKLTTNEIERLIDRIEKEIKKEVPSAKSIQIELETEDV